MQHRNLLQLIKLEHFVPCSERDRDIKHLYAYKDTLFIWTNNTDLYMCIHTYNNNDNNNNVTKCKKLAFCVVW